MSESTAALTRRQRTLDQLMQLTKELAATEAEQEIVRLKHKLAVMERSRDTWRSKAELYRTRLLERNRSK